MEETFIPTCNANSQTLPELSLQDTAPFPRSLQSCSKPQEFLHHQIQAVFPLLLPLQGRAGNIFGVNHQQICRGNELRDHLSTEIRAACFTFPSLPLVPNTLQSFNNQFQEQRLGFASLPLLTKLRAPLKCPSRSLWLLDPTGIFMGAFPASGHLLTRDIARG